jgi:hypothetical protein
MGAKVAVITLKSVNKTKLTAIAFSAIGVLLSSDGRADTQEWLYSENPQLRNALSESDFQLNLKSFGATFQLTSMDEACNTPDQFYDSYDYSGYQYSAVTINCKTFRTMTNSDGELIYYPINDAGEIQKDEDALVEIYNEDTSEYGLYSKDGTEHPQPNYSSSYVVKFPEGELDNGIFTFYDGRGSYPYSINEYSEVEIDGYEDQYYSEGTYTVGSYASNRSFEGEELQGLEITYEGAIPQSMSKGRRIGNEVITNEGATLLFDKNSNLYSDEYGNEYVSNDGLTFIPKDMTSSNGEPYDPAFDPSIDPYAEMEWGNNPEVVDGFDPTVDPYYEPIFTGEGDQVLNLDPWDAKLNSIVSAARSLDENSKETLIGQIETPESEVMYDRSFDHEFMTLEMDSGYVLNGEVYLINENDQLINIDNPDDIYKEVRTEYLVVDGVRYKEVTKLLEDGYSRIVVGYTDESGLFYEYSTEYQDYVYIPEDGSEVIKSYASDFSGEHVSEYVTEYSYEYIGEQMEGSLGSSYMPEEKINQGMGRTYLPQGIMDYQSVYNPKTDEYEDGIIFTDYSGNEYPLSITSDASYGYYTDSNGDRQYMYGMEQNSPYASVESSSQYQDESGNKYLVIDSLEGKFVVNPVDGKKIFSDSDGLFIINGVPVSSDQFKDAELRRFVDPDGNEYFEIFDEYGMEVLWDPETGMTHYAGGSGFYEIYNDNNEFSLDKWNIQERVYLDDENFLVFGQQGDIYVVNAETGSGSPVNYDPLTGSIDVCSAGICYAMIDDSKSQLQTQVAEETADKPLTTGDESSSAYDPLENIGAGGELYDLNGNLLPDETTFVPTTGQFSIGGVGSWDSGETTPEFTYNEDGTIAVSGNSNTPSFVADTNTDPLGLGNNNNSSDSYASTQGDNTTLASGTNSSTGGYPPSDNEDDSEALENQGLNNRSVGNSTGKCAWVYVDKQVAKTLNETSGLKDYTQEMNVIIYDSNTGSVYADKW